MIATGVWASEPKRARRSIHPGPTSKGRRGRGKVFFQDRRQRSQDKVFFLFLFFFISFSYTARLGRSCRFRATTNHPVPRRCGDPGHPSHFRVLQEEPSQRIMLLHSESHLCTCNKRVLPCHAARCFQACFTVLPSNEMASAFAPGACALVGRAVRNAEATTVWEAEQGTR